MNRLMLVTAVIVGSSGLVIAQIKQVAYDGVVISTGAPGYQVPSFATGDAFRVMIGFESSVPDGIVDPTVGQYSGAVRQLSFTVGPYIGFADPGGNIQVGNDYTGQGQAIDY